MLRDRPGCDILDEKHAAFVQRQLLQGMTDHMCIQMAPLAGVYLNGRYSRFPDPLGIV